MGTNAEPDQLAERTVTRWQDGELTTEQVRELLHKARTDAASYSLAAQHIARLIIEAGGSEAATARELGIDRMTVRRALGKLAP